MTKRLKFLSTFFILTLVSVNNFAQLPYSKILDLSEPELKERKFKYDSKKNQFVLTKSNKTNKTINILSAVGGATADMRPHKEDYKLTIQKGVRGATAYLSVIFHDDEAYHNIQTWITENGIEPIESRSGKLELQRFEYDGYHIELAVETVSVQTVTRNTNAAAKSFDESYNIYTYTIDTGVPPASEWHAKERKKKEKKQLKGDKSDINDLM